MRPFHLAVLTGALAAGFAPLASAQIGAPDRGQSKFWSAQNLLTIPQQTTVRTETVNLTQAGNIYVQADGFIVPISQPTSAAAWIWIEVDGVRVSNTSVVDYLGSIAPQPHGFNCIGARALSAGSHSISLVVDARRSSFDLGSASLSVYVNPAQHVIQGQTNSDSAMVQPPVASASQRTTSRCNWTGLPYTEITSAEIPAAVLPAFAFASGRLRLVNNAGDAMIGLVGAPQSDLEEGSSTFVGSYAVQDLYPAAELHASVSVQGVIKGTPASPEYRARFGFGAMEFPPSHHFNGLELGYSVGANATVVALAGGMQIAGSVGKNGGPICGAMCIGGRVVNGCPALGSETVVASATITIPPGHDGIVLFSAKARVQGQRGDEASLTTFLIKVDGVQRGSRGQQGIAGWLGGWDSALSQRTVSASYLATGANRLLPGTHSVQVIARSIASTRPANLERVSIYDDEPILIWID